MSHYIALVITDNGTEEEIEQALQPYHEFECTGIVDEYVQSVDITDEVRDYWHKYNSQLTFLEYIQEEYTNTSILRPGEMPDLLDKCKWGWTQLNSDDEVTVVIKRTNENKHWDWWEVGGRWKDSLLTKSGKFVDSCQYQDLDIRTQAAAAKDVATKEWDKFHSVYAEEISGFQIWSDVRDRIKSVDDARSFYFNQPLAIATKHKGSLFRQDPIFTNFNIDRYTLPKAEYLACAANNAFKFFAVVKDGQWYSSGNMGWFGMSSDNKDNWLEQQAALLATVEPNQWLTVVDCHI